ncbi:MAG TPA: hypothetical protein VHO47_03800 [Candidatus Babeliales bacterium]|nr:hypothetical protein [Candidatus Babeliales bacterium]
MNKTGKQYLDLSHLRKFMLEHDPICRKLENEIKEKEEKIKTIIDARLLEKRSTFSNTKLTDIGSSEKISYPNSSSLTSENSLAVSINSAACANTIVNTEDFYKEIVTQKITRLPNNYKRGYIFPENIVLPSTPQPPIPAQNAVQPAATQQTTIANKVATEAEVRRSARLWDRFEFCAAAGICAYLAILYNSKADIKNLYSYFASFSKK